jgi:putative transposase
MYMPAFKAKKLVKGVSDETEVSDLQGTLAGRSRESASLTLTVQGAEAMKKSKFTEEQILFSLKQADAGQPVTDVCRQMGISEATYEKRAEVTCRKTLLPSGPKSQGVTITRSGSAVVYRKLSIFLPYAAITAGDTGSLREISAGLVGTSVSGARNCADTGPVSCRCLDETLA